MRWMRGGSLRVLLRKGPLTATTTAHLVDQIAAALTAAHRQGLVHGHVKPENILFDDEGNGYLTHFGISSDVRRLRRDGEPAATKPPRLPHRANTRRASHPRSDQYGLGLVVYEVLTGRSPLIDKSDGSRQSCASSQAAGTALDFAI
jgi:serine/threonine-protein kinase